MYLYLALMYSFHGVKASIFPQRRRTAACPASVPAVFPTAATDVGEESS